jgi:Zn-dependent protease with chaperone function
MAAETSALMRLARVLFLTLIAASLTACKTMPEAMSNVPFVASLTQKERGPLDPLPAPKPRVWPNAQQDVINQRARGMGLIHAPEARTYLNTLHARIKTAAGVPDWPGEVYITAQSTLQAYATAAGNLYIALPWLTSVESEDELVALLAHEFGHVYLHYHLLEGAIDSADTAADILSLGVALANQSAQAAGWSKVDTLRTSYAMAKDLAVAFYGRSEEIDADKVALHLTHKIGYSYEHGPKAFLERLAGWEDKNEGISAKKQEELLAALRESTLAESARRRPKTANELSNAMNSAQAEVQAGINVAGIQLFADIGKALSNLTSSHPDTLKRQDTLAQLAERTPELQADRAPVSAPLKAMLAEPRTAQTLKHYELAFQALESPQSSQALGWARQSITGPTSTHLVPLLAMVTVASSQPRPVRGLPTDLTQLFEANINSETDRAWYAYAERITRLKQRGQRADANRVLQRGMAQFAQAEEIMPFTISYYGETESWAKAKEKAQDCSQRFPGAKRRCSAAALSPSEVAEVKRQEKLKAEQLVDKLKKKP